MLISPIGLKCCSTNRTHSIYYSPKDYATFFYSFLNFFSRNEDNTSKIKFITGDQPVVNLRALDDEETKELELYYPISPKTAIKLFLNSENDERSTAYVDVKDSKSVKKLNERICKNSDYIFASSKNELQELLRGMTMGKFEKI